VEELCGGQARPVLLECCCYRWQEHVGPSEDFQAGYRTREEAQPWIDDDPLELVGQRLPVMVRHEIEHVVDREIAEAFDAAEHDPFPTAEELYTDLYA
jgi:pyruvate dehydrogenase E1 component alpha subunit